MHLLGLLIYTLQYDAWCIRQNVLLIQCVQYETVRLERTLQTENTDLFFLLLTSNMLPLFDLEIIKLLY